MHSQALSRSENCWPVPFDSGSTVLAGAIIEVPRRLTSSRRIYCLSPGEAWFHQFLIDRFSPQLAPRQRWIRVTSRSDPPPSLWSRTKFSARTLLRILLSLLLLPFLRPSVPLVLLTAAV